MENQDDKKTANQAADAEIDTLHKAVEVAKENLTKAKEALRLAKKSATRNEMLHRL